MNKKILISKVREINQVIDSECFREGNVGVLSGASGISLFKFYYSSFFKDDEKSDLGLVLLENSINKINNGFDNTTFCSGITGMAWTIDHLMQFDFLEIDCDKFLSSLDDSLNSRMISDLKVGNYDFLHGAIGYALYFLKRYENSQSANLKRKYRGFLEEFLWLLEKMAHKTSINQLKWISILDRNLKISGVNLSLSHGMGSIIGILSKMAKHDEFKAHSTDLLKKAINYVIGFNDKSSLTSRFPIWIPDNTKINYDGRVAWCYGDLGLGIQLWYASNVLNDKSLRELSLEILNHSSKRNLESNNKVVDASICHGSFGNAKVFHRIYKETKIDGFKRAYQFWINDGFSKAIHTDGYLGYMQWKGFEKKWVKELSLLEGIAGIGLTILDVLRDEDTSWDECLMLS